MVHISGSGCSPLAFALVVVTSTLGAARPAAASPEAQAAALFSEAKDLMKAGKFPEACAAFEASQKLVPTTTTLVNLADCREKAQQYATAWGAYLQVERELRGLGDESSQKLRELVIKRAATLQPTLSSLTIDVPPSARIGGLEIIRDNEHVDAGAWNRELPIDGGTYKVSARATGRREWTTTVVLKPSNDHQVISVPALPEAPPPAPIAPPVVEARSPAATSAPDVVTATDDTGRGRTYLPYALAGGAIALGVGAAIAEHSASSVYDDAKRSSDRARQVDLWSSANDRRELAVGLAVGAAAAAGVAVYLFVRQHERPGATTTVMAPTLAADGMGVVVAHRW